MELHGATRGDARGPPFVRYHTFGETEADLETGIPVAEAVAGEGRTAAGELPGGAPITTWHLGSHDGLADAYGRLGSWQQANGREADGAAWEVYWWIDPSVEPDPAAWPAPTQWRTQLVQPNQVILLTSGARPMPNANEAASTSKPDRSPEHTAERYVERLQSHRSPADAAKRQRYLKSRAGDGDVVIGVRMKHVFELSKEFKEMPLGEIELLLESRIHEVRAGGVKIMAYQAASKTTPEGRRREVFELYLRRHDRINDWDLVDLGAWDVVGRYLVDKPREVLYQLARSTNVWERRAAILATLYFVRQGDLDDTFRIADELVNDDHDLVQKAVGGSLREAGKHDRGRLLGFLDDHAATMPRTVLRYAIEHLDKDQRSDYMTRKKLQPRP